MIYLSNEPYPQEISVPRSFGVIVPHRNEYLSTADIAANLTTDSDHKVLAASQGVVLKGMVDAKADKSNTYTKAQVNSALALKADKSNTYTKAQVDGALAGKADVSDIPTKTSDLQNDSGFVTGQEVSQTYETKSDATAKETALQNAINGKQDILTFDNVPTNGSSNPVKSDGIYDALATKQPNISDLQTIRSGAAAGASAVQPSQMQVALATKQDTLESGVNIKTINNQSLLGSGNIDIQGGGGEPEIFWAEYGVTTYNEVVAAFNEGASVVMSYDSRLYIMADTDRIDAAWFTADMGTELHRARVTKTNQWIVDAIYPQMISDKVSDIPANRTSTSKYPNTKAVYDALGKYGVISQTQTWTGSDSTGYDYTMSNPVWGLIPQANIDLYVSAGAVFNDTTGYFELNGLTDISYNEMKQIYSDTIGCVPLMQNRVLNLTGTKARTNIPMAATTSYGITLNYLAYANGIIEVVAFRDNMQINSVLSAPFLSCRRLKKIIGVIILAVASGAHSSAFNNCASLESITLKGIKIGVTFPDSPRLSLESVVYMVTNAANTTAITITLHATAYARCQADTTEYTYQGNTYTGIIAYANARNITIASA